MFELYSTLVLDLPQFALLERAKFICFSICLINDLCDKYNTICYSDELIWDVEHLGYTAICEEAYNELTVN